METKKQSDFVSINTWRLLNFFKKKQKISDKIVKLFKECLKRLK